MKMTPTKKPRRLTLRGWAALEDFRGQMDDKAEEGDVFSVCGLIYKCIDLVETDVLVEEIPWTEAANLFMDIVESNKLTIRFPILSTKPKNVNKHPWEYQGRTWFFWLNIFASTYGWSESDIAKLDPDDAIGLYQEICLDQQMQQEWEWGLSEIAYQYQPSTKKSVFKKLERPEWMKQTVQNYKPKKVVKTMIRKDMIPMGVVINLDMDN